MDPETRSTYKFGDVEVDLTRMILRRGGSEQRLRNKTFAVLAYLIEHRENDVSKDEIIHEVWRDAAVVDDVLVQSIKDIRRALGDDTKQPRFVKTLPKFGYRFIGEIDPPMVANGSQISQPTSFSRNRRLVFTLIAAGLLLALAVILIPSVMRPSDGISFVQTPGKKSVMVMFFENQTKESDLDWLREGLADMLITGLARSPNLTVLSRVQLHVLLDRNAISNPSLPQLLDIARKSGSEILVSGSFSRLGEKMRLDTQAYDAKSGSLLASESLTVDRPDQILTEIDLISLKLASKLGGGSSGSAHGVARSMTDNLEAYRYYSLAVEKAHALHSDEAIALLERAIALDPEFAMAHARIGYTYAVAAGEAEKGKPALERAFRLSGRLTEGDRLNIAAWYSIANLDYLAAISAYQEAILKFPNEIEAYWRLGRLLLGEERYDDAISVLKQGLIVDPDAKNIYNALSVTYRDSNRHAEAVAMAERYAELAPNEPNALDTLALAQQAKGEYTAAAVSYRKALEMSPKFAVAVLHLANLRYQTGEYREAISLYRRYIELSSSDTDKAWGWARIAWVNWKKGDPSAAAAATAMEQKLDPNSFIFPLLIAIEGRDAVKVSTLRRRLDTQPQYSERGLRPSLRLGLFLRGKLASFDGNESEAAARFAEALKHRALVWDIEPLENCLARSLSASELTENALNEYKRILKLNPNYPEAAFEMAKIYERIGDTNGSLQSYAGFLRTWPNADEDLSQVIEAKRILAFHGRL